MKAVEIYGQDRLYWTTDFQLKSCRTDGSDVIVIKDNLREPYGIFVDFLSNKLYWTDILPAEIYMSNLDGANTQTVQDLDIHWPGPMTYDIKNKSFYWIELIAETLKKYSPDVGTEVIFNSSLSNLELDTCNNYLYVSIGQEGIIKRIDLDDNYSTKTIISYAGIPYGLAINVKNNLLYWGDFGNGKIFQSTLDGNNINELFTSNSKRITSVELDVSQQRIYWLEKREGVSKGAIKSINTDGTDYKLILEENTASPNFLMLGTLTQNCEPEFSPFSESPKVNIFPNPVFDYLYIQNVSFFSIEIYSTTGVLVKEFKSDFPRLDLTFLANGIYILKITSDEVENIFKIIKI